MKIIENQLRSIISVQDWEHDRHSRRGSWRCRGEPDEQLWSRTMRMMTARIMRRARTLVVTWMIKKVWWWWSSSSLWWQRRRHNWREDGLPPQRGWAPPAYDQDRIACIGSPDQKDYFDDHRLLSWNGNKDDDAIFVTINVDIEDLTCPGQDPLHSWLPMHLPTRTIWGGKTWIFWGISCAFYLGRGGWGHSGH